MFTLCGPCFRCVGLAVMLVVAATRTSSGEFLSDLTLSGNLADPLHVVPGTSVAVAVLCQQTYGTASDENDISRIQLNWMDSSASLNLATSSTWTWDDSTGHPSVYGLGATVNDSTMSDLIVNRQNAGVGIAPTSPFSIGTLAFAAPAAEGAYTVRLTGGSDDNETSTAVLDGDNAVTLAIGGLTVGSYSFTVVPEPSTGILLFSAAAGTWLFRRRTRSVGKLGNKDSNLN
jgi:hypothetical protein